MRKHLCEEFERFEGQPCRIFTDDHRTHCGIVLEPHENSVRIIDECNRINLIEFCHIVAVEEPQMRLHFCGEDLCPNDHHNHHECEHEEEDECGREEEEEECGCGRVGCCC